MRRAVIAGLVVVAAVVVAWKLACNRGSDGTPTATRSAAGSATSGTRIVKPAATPASLSGWVTKHDGNEPIAGAVVAIMSTAVGPRVGPLTETPSTVVVADASGAWSVPAIAPGGYKVTATAAGFLPASTDKLAIAAGEPTVRRSIVKALGKWAAVTLRDGGGIYRVPSVYAAELRRLQGAVEKIGTSRVHVLPVHESQDASRALGAIATASLEAELAQLPGRDRGVRVDAARADPVERELEDELFDRLYVGSETRI